MRKLHALLCALLLLANCKKIEVRDPRKPKTPGESTYLVYITNEGNFQSVNSDVTRYDPKDGDLDKDYYALQNNGLKPGDVCQSLTYTGEFVYLVMNNSARIEKVRAQDFRKAGSLTGLTSPRYLVVKEDKGYVSDLYADKVSEIDLSTGSITKQIPLKGWTEEMLVTGDTLWITNLHSEYVYLADINTGAIRDSIKTGYASASIRKDKNGNVWILSQGDQMTGKPPVLTKINVRDRSSMDISLPAGSVKLKINGQGDQLYFIANGIYRMHINDGQAPSSPWIEKNGRNIYGIGIDPFNEDVYISDAHDFVSEGTIYHYTKNKTLVRTFKAGINPADFYFF